MCSNFAAKEILEVRMITGYVIVRATDGKYLGVCGKEKTFVDKLEDAQVYTNVEDARAEACCNEYVAPLSGFLNIK